jgi:hypothetical protein
MSNNTTQISIKPSELVQVLEDCLTCDLVPFIQAAPGVGKSTIVKQFSVERNRNFHDFRLSYRAPTDVRGYPIVDRSGPTPLMDFAMDKEYPREPNNVWLLDEFPCASKATQNASLQLLLDRCIGDYKVPDDTLICLAGNRAMDRAHVERISSATQNRLMDITLRVDTDEWTAWALSAGINPMIIAYLQMCPGHLSDFNGMEWKGGAFASPRSWEMASKLITNGKAKKGVRMAMLAGLIGPAVGAQFGGFCSVYDELPDVNAILMTPDTSDVPTEPSVQYALSVALSNKSTASNFDRVLRYVTRLPKPIEVLCVKLAIQQKTGANAPFKNPAFQRWASDNGSVVLGTK